VQGSKDPGPRAKKKDQKTVPNLLLFFDKKELLLLISEK